MTESSDSWVNSLFGHDNTTQSDTAYAEDTATDIGQCARAYINEPRNTR